MSAMAVGIFGLSHLFCVKFRLPFNSSFYLVSCYCNRPRAVSEARKAGWKCFVNQAPIPNYLRKCNMQTALQLESNVGAQVLTHSI